MTSPRRFEWLRAGIAPAIYASLLSFQALCAVSFPLLLGDPQSGAIQEAPSDAVPIPAGMYWGPFTLRLVASLSRLSAVPVFVFQVGMFLGMLYCLIRILNPSFRMTTGVDWDETVFTRTYMHTGPLIKIFLIAVTAFVPLLAAYRLLAWLPIGASASLAAGCVLSGAAAWFLFSRNGVAGDLDSGNYLLPRDPREIGSLILRGSLAGLAVYAIALSRPPALAGELIQLYRSLGYIGQSAWWNLALWTCGFSAAAAFTASGLALALGSPGSLLSRRVLQGAVAGLMLGAVVVARNQMPTSWAASRYDYLPRSTASEAERLRRAADIPGAAGPEQTLLFLGRRAALPMRVSGSTADGLPATPQTAERVRNFLARRGGRTALGEVASRTLFDISCLSWEPQRVLDVCRERLATAPDALWLSLNLEKLQYAPANAATRAHAASLSNGRSFVVTSDQAELAIGDIHARLGDRNAATSWYRKADLTTSGIAERAPERTMFAGGAIRGVLRRNGRPAPGARVGVVLQGALRQRRGMFLRPGVLRPFWLRTIMASSATSADGSFELTDLIAGNYQLIVSIPGLRAEPLQPVPMTCSNGDISEVFVGFGKPKVYLGEIDIQDVSEDRGAAR